MKRIIFMALLCVIAVLLITACGRGETYEEEAEYQEALPENGEAAPAGSVTMPTVDEMHENLALLGKVWGFAKYNHPVFLTGQLCWDAELLRLFPPVLEGGDVREILYEWFVGLGDGDLLVQYGVYFNLANLVHEIENEIWPQINNIQGTTMTELQEFVAYFTEILDSDAELGWRDFLYIIENRFPHTHQTIMREEEVDLRPMADLSWIDYENLGPLAARLLQLDEIRVVGKRYAPVRIGFLFGATDFSNQIPRGTMDFGSPGERLLSLFRLWNTMNYFFPHLDVLDVPWNDLLPRFIPKMLEGTDRVSHELVLAALTHYLHDANVLFFGIPYFSRKFGNVVAPVQLVPAEGRLVVYRVAAEGVPLMRGDVILSVNGRDIDEIVSEMKPFISYPNEEKALTILGGRWPFPDRLSPGYPHALTSDELFMDIDVLRGGRFGMTFNILGSRMSTTTTQVWVGTRFSTIILGAPLLPQAADSHVLHYGNIGLINPWVQEDLRYIMENFASTDGIIIDFRWNPHWDFTNKMLEYLIEEPQPVAYLSRFSINSPGRRFDSLQNNNLLNPRRNPYALIYDRPVVLLMDESITHSAQWSIMSLSTAPNVTVIGTHSMGTVGGWDTLPLPGGIDVRFTSTGVYTLEGEPIHRMGLAPDIRVERTIQGIAENRDEIMEAAVRFILGER